MSLKAGIWASRLGFDPWGCVLGFQLTILALRLPQDYLLSIKGGAVEGREKISLNVKAKVFGLFEATAQKEAIIKNVLNYVLSQNKIS